MKKLILASIVLASAATAQASDMTLLSTTLPTSRGALALETKFYIDTTMKEAFAKVAVDDVTTVYVWNCNGNGGYYGPRGPYRPFPGNYPGNYCNNYPQTQYRNLLSEKVKIEGMTMNGDDVIFQGTEGDVVCGTMGRSRVFRVPTFFLSDKCELAGSIVNENGVNKLKVTFKTK